VTCGLMESVGTGYDFSFKIDVRIVISNSKQLLLKKDSPPPNSTPPHV